MAKKKKTKKTAPRKVNAKKRGNKKPTAKKAAKKATAKKTSAKKSGGSKSSGKKSGGKKLAAKKVVARKSKSPQKSAAPTESLLHVGEYAPDFTLPNASGDSVSLNSFRGRKVVIYFYPKDDTPGCTQQSCDFRDNLARVQFANAEVIGISRDSVASHVKFRNKFSLPFPLLSDEDGHVCESYGVWKEKSMYGKAFMGIERSTFIIDEEGRIAHIYPKVSVTGHVDQVIHDLKGGA